jgi:hypothetical protein
VLSQAVGQLGGVSRLTNLPICTIFQEGNGAKKSLLGLAILIFISLDLTHWQPFAASNQSLRSLR